MILRIYRRHEVHSRKENQLNNIIQFVTEKNGQAITTSRKASEVFGKLETAVINSYENPFELAKNLEYLNNALKDFPESLDYPFLANAIREQIMRNYLDCTISERDVQNWFKENVKTLLGNNYSLVELKNSPKHIPDAWLKHGIEYIPVEIKLNGFTKKSLTQLERYMDFFHCQKGIAVGKALNCILPKTVKFIPYNLEEVIKYE